MAAYGDRDSQRVLPIAPIRNQFSGEQPTSYMSLHPVEDVGVSLLFYLYGRVIVSFSLDILFYFIFLFRKQPECRLWWGRLHFPKVAGVLSVSCLLV
jgi:hypothetical protein